MQLFTGMRDSANNMVWELSPQPLQLESDLDLVVEQQAEFPGGYEAFMKYVRKNITYPAEARRNGVEGTVIVRFIVDEYGQVLTPEVVRKVHPTVDSEVVEGFAAMPPWNPGRRDGKPAAMTMTFPVTFSTGGITLSMSSEARNAYAEELVTEFRKTMTDSSLKTNSADEVGFYVLETSRLGWINCDRFVEADDLIAFRLLIPGDRKQEVDVKLIFSDIRSVLPGRREGDHIYFRVPRRSRAHILALRTNGKQLEMATEKVSFGNASSAGLPAFHPVTVAALNEFLNTIESRKNGG